MFDPTQIRAQFPFFSHHPQLAFFDNAATTQKPARVIQAIHDFYEKGNAPVHRGIYELAAQSSQQYELVRQKVATWLHAEKAENVVFTSGTTASINLVAQSFLAPRLQAGDEVVISAMEHHANLIPWQQVCKRKKAHLRVIPMDASGQLDLEAYEKMLTEKVKMVAIVHISNTLGTINPVAEMVKLAHTKNIPVLIDGAQSAAYYQTDVQALDADFWVCSAHKMFGPTGIGILYAKEKHLASMEPVQFGGGAIRSVHFEETEFRTPPKIFEPGTPHIAGVIGLGAAIDFLNEQVAPRRHSILEHLGKLTGQVTEELIQIKGVRIIGAAPQKSAIVSFTLTGIHPHDMATFLSTEGIAVRAGHHCTQPVMDFFKIPGTIRLSLAFYNTEDEIKRLVRGVLEAKDFFQ